MGGVHVVEAKMLGRQRRCVAETVSVPQGRMQVPSIQFESSEGAMAIARAEVRVVRPATRCLRVVSSAVAQRIAGRMVGRRRLYLQACDVVSRLSALAGPGQRHAPGRTPSSAALRSVSEESARGRA